MSIFAERRKGEEDCSIKMKEVLSQNPKWRADVQREKLGTSCVPRLLETSRKSGHERAEGDKSLVKEMFTRNLWKKWYEIFITRSTNLGLLFVYNGNLWK